MFNTGDSIRLTWFMRLVRKPKEIARIARPGRTGVIAAVHYHPKLAHGETQTYHVKLDGGGWLDGVSQYFLFIFPVLKRIKGGE